MNGGIVICQEKKANCEFSIIVLVCNPTNDEAIESQFELCIESILAHSSVPYELIVVDGCNSGIQTFDYLGFLRDSVEIDLRYVISNQILRIGQSFNLGMKISRGKYIVCMASDTIVTKEWLEKIRDSFETDSSVGIVGPVFNVVDTPWQKVGNENWNEMGKFEDSVEHNRVAEVKNPGIKHLFQDFVVSVVICFRREIYEKIGGFDERFTGPFEDVDFCWRAKELGYKIMCARNTFIWHWGRGTRSVLDGYNNLSREIPNFNENYDKFIEKWRLKRWRM